MRLEEEKELLVLKGNILRLKFPLFCKEGRGELLSAVDF